MGSSVKIKLRAERNEGIAVGDSNSREKQLLLISPRPPISHASSRDNAPAFTSPPNTRKKECVNIPACSVFHAHLKSVCP